MSLTTRCPACGTTFRVVPDQLKISDGWVRCGSCSDVFDATLSLARLAEAATLASAETAALAAPSAGLAPPPPPPAPSDSAPVVAPSLAAVMEPLPPLTPIDASPQLELTVEAPAPVTPDVAETQAAPVARAAERHSIVDGAQRRASPWHKPDEAVASAEAGFMRQARAQARWKSLPVRAGLSVLVLLLAALLGGQYAYTERDRLALLYPEATPWLQEGCEWLGCALGPLRQIESIQVENSGFVRLRSDAYRLSVTLRNQSDLTLAMPHLELSLTDAQDQTLVRRVLTPAQINSTQGVISPQAEHAAYLGVTVGTLPAAARVAGYRLLAFYP